MYEVKQAQVARAIDVLRTGPMTAAAFAVKMWPDRVVGRTPGQHAKMGHALLQRLGQLNYVERIGDLWTIRRLNGSYIGDTAAMSGDPTVGYVGGLPAMGSLVGSPTGVPVVSPNGSAKGHAGSQADQLRLAWLVQQATEPVLTIVHDQAFGNLTLRGERVGAALVEACAIVTLFGSSLNVYPPFASRMIVGLTPVEGARVLHVRWRQSGQPPDLPRAGSWIRLEDGLVAMPGFWRPAGAPDGWVEPEDIRDRIARLRRGAGLA